MDHIAVAHDVFFAFDGHLARFFAFGFAAEGEQIFPPDDFGLDEAALKIRMDDACRLRRRGALDHSPSATLLFTSREKSNEPEQFIAGANDRMESRLLEARALQKFG